MDCAHQIRYANSSLKLITTVRAHSKRDDFQYLRQKLVSSVIGPRTS